MKICGLICEYNPFHNGHAYQLRRIREESGCDKILCVMSGNFTQRGEIAVFHKSVRARHAVENGADLVLELPSAFAVAPAELFARGAVKLLCSLPDVTTLAFGCESGTKESFLSTATAAQTEDKQWKAALKEKMKDGTSYAKARTELLLEQEGVDRELLTSPNNILGVEYCRAILSEGSKIEPLPLLRVGSGYLDGKVQTNFSSATALRDCMRDLTRKNKKLLRSNLPQSVYRDAINYTPLPYALAVMCALTAASKEDLASICDCSEGLENKLKALSKTNPDLDELLKKAVSKRYTLSRLKRILCANFLSIREKDVRDYLTSPLYYNVLAVKRDSAEELLAALGRGSYPLIARKSDVSALKKDALACYLSDIRANDLYNVLSGTHTNEYQTLFV